MQILNRSVTLCTVPPERLSRRTRVKRQPTKKAHKKNFSSESRDNFVLTGNEMTSRPFWAYVKLQGAFIVFFAKQA